MERTVVSEIYEIIINYYRETDSRKVLAASYELHQRDQELLHELLRNAPDDELTSRLASTRDTQQKVHPDIADAFRLFKCMDAASREEYENLLEEELEGLQRKLKKHFRYLMRNVLCQNMGSFKEKGARGTYFVYTKDVPVIETILLHSVSENQSDLIIGRWLDGKIADSSYHEIYDLYQRLYVLIHDLETVDDALKQQWIQTFELALRVDFAEVMVSFEGEMRQLFWHSLPFRCGAGSLLSEEESHAICHADIRQELINTLDGMQINSVNTMFKAVYQYMETLNFKRLQTEDDFPPVELMKLKCICEYMYDNDLKRNIPHTDLIDQYTEHFIKIDTEWEKKVNNKRRQDRTQYQKKKTKNKQN